MYTHPTALRCRTQGMRLDSLYRYSRTEIADRCQMSRTTFYKWLRRFQESEGDLISLQDRSPGRGVMPNQTPLEWELAILDYVRDFPTQGARRVSQTLRNRSKNPIPVGESAVRGVLRRHGLSTPKERLALIEHHQPPRELTPWEEDKEASKHRHLKAPFPGYLVSIDGKTIGRLLEIGRVYVQAAIDVHSRYATARLYRDKKAESTSDFLQGAVEEATARGVRWQRILTDNGKEYTSNRPERHPFELACKEHELKHRRTKVKHPWTNGMAERFLQTLGREFFAVALRKRCYTRLEDLQTDLDQFLVWYNTERPHQGIKGLSPIMLEQGSTAE